MKPALPDWQTVRLAADRIGPYIKQTPVLTSRTLDAMVGNQVFFKCENFQRIGAFKARGAHNAVLSLARNELGRGVVTHSSGNHAAALALAAKSQGIPAYIVMPRNSSAIKIASVERLGGAITFCEPTTEARESTATELGRHTGATMIHPFDDWNVIAGQGTAALELVTQVRDQGTSLDALIAPVGGGGLLSGSALVARHWGIPIYGAEPEGADDAQRSLRSGTWTPVSNPQTIADGLRTSLGERPFTIIQSHVSDIATVSDDEIEEAMLLVWQILKIIIEPSCAVPVAALLKRRLPLQQKRIGVILSGGNVDLFQLPWLTRATRQ